MRALIGLLSLAALAGCGSSDAQPDQSRQIAAKADAVQVAALQQKVTDLEARLNKSDADTQSLRVFALSINDDLDSLRKTFNGNVDKSNAAKVANLTAAGACGQEWVRYPDGGQVWRNKACTLKDLR